MARKQSKKPARKKPVKHPKKSSSRKQRKEVATKTTQNRKASTGSSAPANHNKAASTSTHKKPSQNKKANKQPTHGSVFRSYISLMRLDRPIGILLLLWPTYWSLLLAARGMPSIDNVIIFTLGCILMRSAGCVINDYADRNIDGHVERTRNRPLATGLISANEALLLFFALCGMAFILVLLTNPLTIKLSFGAVFLASIYPFMKRYTHMPQVFLGAAFAWSIPMAFAAELGELSVAIWLLYVAVVIWAVIYDTFYAMVDRDDDLKIGVKSTAILFGEADRFITGFLQLFFMLALILAGRRFELSWAYYISLIGVAGLFVYQQKLIQFREKEECFKAFLNNNYVGLVVLIGIAAGLYIH